MLTEQTNPRTQHFDQLSASEIVQIMNDEDTTVAQVVRDALPFVAQSVDAIVNVIESGGRLIYIGAGTSGRLGVLDAVECVPTYNTDPSLVVGIIAGGRMALTDAIEGAEDHGEDGRHDLEAIQLQVKDIVVGIAASGHTPYVLGAVTYANEIGAVSVGIACNQPSLLLDISQIAIGLPVGPEVVTGSTQLKAGTAQKMVLNMLSTASMVRLGKVYGNQMIDLRVTNAKLARRAEGIVAQIAHVTIDEARHLLALTGNNVKAAIVVHIKQATPEEAFNLLEGVGGHLRALIG